MQPSQFQSDSIFWIDVEKIAPNPYQPRREFDEGKLRDLSESIRQYGVLQPIVVTRHETLLDDGSLVVDYELVAGERRHRASKLAGLSQIPAVIRNPDESDQMKLELAIIENLQREDLNAIDRANAFDQLAKEFGFKHLQIASKVGKSREYVSNSIRLLALPEEIQQSVVGREISEGHARSLLMLIGRDEQQQTLYKEIKLKKLTVRETEHEARRLAQDRVRKRDLIDPQLIQLEGELTETLGTRVQIQQKEVGGRVVIEYFSSEDLKNLLEQIQKKDLSETIKVEDTKENPEEDMYSIKNFSI